MIADHHVLTTLLREIGIGLISFIIGMNIYIMYKVQQSKAPLIHKKLKSFKKMTNAILWLYANQTILFAMILTSRANRLLTDAPIVWLDWLGIPVFLSYILFNRYIIKNYILAALNGSLFDKKEIPLMRWED